MRRAVIALVILLTSCARTAVIKPDVQHYQLTAYTRPASTGTYDEWQHWLKAYGLPPFKTVDEGLTFFTNSANVAAASSNFIVGNATPFDMALSGGAKTDNMHVEILASVIFQPYGKESIPKFIELLDSDELYLRYAAVRMLCHKAGRYDHAYDFRAPKQQRQPAVQSWRDWWKANEKNPRLDRQPNRWYEAADWEHQTTRMDKRWPQR